MSCRGQGGQDRRANRGPGRREQSDGSGGGFTRHNADSESSWRRPVQLSLEQGQGRRDQVNITRTAPHMIRTAILPRLPFVVPFEGSLQRRLLRLRVATTGGEAVTTARGPAIAGEPQARNRMPASNRSPLRLPQAPSHKALPALDTQFRRSCRHHLSTCCSKTSSRKSLLP